MGEMERYRKAVQYLDGLGNLPRSDDYMSGRTNRTVFLKRTRDFLDALGNPERGFRYVHVTGTAGKGTVATMVHNALLASGKRVGSFTSPYVTAAIEKIRAGELYIAPGEFADIVEELKPHIDKAHFEGRFGRPSYFELYFAIALLYFKKMQCEWVVLEVGAGGRYDATNIIEDPRAVAVTSIDYDHVQILGKTLQSIADNKAGIIKKGTAFFTTEKRPMLLKLFERECKRVKASFTALPVSEDYQEDNRTLARAICHSLGLPEKAIEKSVRDTRLPCRFETVRERPAVVLDGAHNRAKMRSTVHNLKKLRYKKLHLVIGINAKKDARAMLREIVPLASRVYATRFRLTGVECTDPKALQAQAREFFRSSAKSSVFLDSEHAFAEACTAAAPDDLVLVTGSFYLAGELRQRWYPEEWVLRRRKSFR